ncbi:BBE domain-containing protein [Bradyrhizobium neotropicale]|uniref:BBE domain-containing protein n=1 Tax=Bradyrhizobium neotropicale TaxID=1497615 RepID=UPI003907EAB5
MVGEGEVARATASFGRNAERLLGAKRLYDPDNAVRYPAADPCGGSMSGKWRRIL